MAEQEALLESYRSTREIRQRQAELKAAYKEFDEVWGKTDNEAKDIVGNVEATPRYHDHEVGTSTSTADSEEE